MSNDKCENCKHYVAISDDAGECHRNPPVCLATVLNVNDPQYDADLAFDGVWPSVPAVGRCGKFENAV